MGPFPFSSIMYLMFPLFPVAVLVHLDDDEVPGLTLILSRRRLPFLFLLSIVPSISTRGYSLFICAVPISSLFSCLFSGRGLLKAASGRLGVRFMEDDVPGIQKFAQFLAFNMRRVSVYLARYIYFRGSQI